MQTINKIKLLTNLILKKQITSVFFIAVKHFPGNLDYRLDFVSFKLSVLKEEPLWRLPASTPITELTSPAQHQPSSCLDLSVLFLSFDKYAQSFHPMAAAFSSYTSQDLSQGCPLSAPRTLTPFHLPHS